MYGRVLTGWITGWERLIEWSVFGNYLSRATEETDNINLRKEEIKIVLFKNAFKLPEDFDFVTIKILSPKADKKESCCGWNKVKTLRPVSGT